MRCPLCGEPAVSAHRPFCSVRCRQVDLGRWLSGEYAIPGPPVLGDEGRDPEAASEAALEGALDGDGQR